MKFIILILFMMNAVQASVKFDVRWNANFRKELVISCHPRDNTCMTLCQKGAQCIIQENTCRDCIGTGLRMSHLIEELGNSIQNDGSYYAFNRVLDLVSSGHFVSLIPNDAYNVIDGVNSIRGLKKFESLCPVGSEKQILLLSVQPETRKIQRPEIIICDFYGRSYFYGITTDPGVLIEDHQSILPLL